MFDDAYCLYSMSFLFSFVLNLWKVMYKLCIICLVKYSLCEPSPHVQVNFIIIYFRFDLSLSV